MVALTEKDLMAVKGEVIAAALGICSLEEVELFRRLEELYWKGFKAALERCNNDVHPDTVRLNHLIVRDQSVMALIDDNKPFTGGTVESINFIFENSTGVAGRGASPEEVRNAIDVDIAKLAARTGVANSKSLA